MILIQKQFLIGFRQYFRFFVFFKYLLRHFKKKRAKGFLSYFFLVPRFKKNRNARMGKGNGAYKGYYWKSKPLTPFLTFLNTSSFFFSLFLKKLNQKLPGVSTVVISKKFFFKKVAATSRDLCLIR